jgi:hypothetical protein
MRWLLRFMGHGFRDCQTARYARAARQTQCMGELTGVGSAPTAFQVRCRCSE